MLQNQENLIEVINIEIPEDVKLVKKGEKAKLRYFKHKHSRRGLIR